MLFIPDLCLYLNLYISASIFLILNVKFSLFCLFNRYCAENPNLIFLVFLGIPNQFIVFISFNFSNQFESFYIINFFLQLNLGLSPFPKVYDYLFDFDN